MIITSVLCNTAPSFARDIAVHIEDEAAFS